MIDLDCPELVKQWRKLVNDNVQMGRDAHLIKRFMADYGATPDQILLGIYQYKDVRTVSIPQFLRQWESWLVADEWLAELELAVCICMGNAPPEYYVYHDLVDDVQNSDDVGHLEDAKQKLSNWKERVLMAYA